MAESVRDRLPPLAGCAKAPHRETVAGSPVLARRERRRTRRASRTGSVAGSIWPGLDRGQGQDVRERPFEPVALDHHIVEESPARRRPIGHRPDSIRSICAPPVDRGERGPHLMRHKREEIILQLLGLVHPGDVLENEDRTGDRAGGVPRAEQPGPAPAFPGRPRRQRRAACCAPLHHARLGSPASVPGAGPNRPILRTRSPVRAVEVSFAPFSRSARRGAPSRRRSPYRSARPECS